MKPENRLDQHVSRRGQVVFAAPMTKLMRDNRFELGWREL
jgi:hypothetical protein